MPDRAEREPAPRIAGADARRRKILLHKLAIARSDIAAAWHATKLLQEQVREWMDALYVPLFHGIVTSYGRPFSRNRPFGPLPDAWSHFDLPRLQRTHDALIEARNQYVAHSDLESRDVQIIPPGARIGDRDAGSLMVGIGTVWWPIRNFGPVLDTCEDLSRRLDAETERLLQELYGGRTDLPTEAFKLDPDSDP